MRQISKKLKTEILADPYYLVCARADEGCCDGRITWEHAIIYAGRQVNAKWAIIPLCTYHHSVDHHQDGDGLNKEKNEMIALNRATEQEILGISKAVNYLNRREFLNKKYATQ